MQYEIVEQLIAKALGARAVSYVESLQSLWSGYGEIYRCRVDGALTSSLNSVVVKHIKLPEDVVHPRGWNTPASHARKIKSYHVEANWYGHWQVQEQMYLPQCHMIRAQEDEFLLVLEDLDAMGFRQRFSKVGEVPLAEVRLCLQWLANLHGRYLYSRDHKPDTIDALLWPQGGYWHLATRQEELLAMQGGALRAAAISIDKQLLLSPYLTIIHGDAKLANFCFDSQVGRVAAVDFQYVGGGCGIEDVMLLISSCFYSDQCFRLEAELLDYYFLQLKVAIAKRHLHVDFELLEHSWRSLYSFAWADFVRFLSGWSPGHWKLHDYAHSHTQAVLQSLR